ncbi:MAG: alpha/beta hydrolase [bacterium]|nr:alpha/beta hydrolase [bacterium]
MNSEKVIFSNNKNQRISGRIYKSEEMSSVGVVFSHGLFSGKDGYKITRLAKDIVAAGFTLLTFDFSFCGESEGKIEDISILQEAEDLKSAVVFFKDYGIKDIHLMGSSMGGVVSLLYASKKSDGVKSLITIATPVKQVELFSDHTKIADIDLLPDDGVTLIDAIPVKNTFFKELKAIDLAAALNDITLPVLIFHGKKDSVVDISNAELLRKNLNGYTRSVIIEDGDHNLTRDEDLAVLRKNIVDWLIGKKKNILI